MSALKVGQPAPEFTLPTVDGQTISLAELRQAGHHVLLVFLRHLG